MEFFFLILIFCLIASLHEPDKYLDLGGNDITEEMHKQQERDRQRWYKFLEFLHLKKKDH